MAKIKHTKNELKAQREALSRYERFLPMLQLKKQQLQVEIQGIDAAIAEQTAEEKKLRADRDAWVRMFADSDEIEQFVALEGVDTDSGNIAGVVIPILREVRTRTEEPDLFATPAWYDEAIEITEALIQRRKACEILEEQKRLIVAELRTTTQRVNLFEKVKIPETRDHIRTIRIFLGDEQTAAVARGKIAKARAVAYQAAKEATQLQGAGV